MSAIARAAAMNPMTTAPRDGTVLRLFHRRVEISGRWNQQRVVEAHEFLGAQPRHSWLWRPEDAPHAMVADEWLDGWLPVTEDTPHA